MIIKPKIRGFICTTAHPAGCAQHVQNQIDSVKSQPPIKNGPQKVLVLGSSQGFGLASRIVASFAGSRASTIGVFFEKAAEKNRTASAGWYNSVAFERKAHAEGIYAKSLNGDAFSDEMKESVKFLIKKDLDQVDLIIYSLAAPRRVHPKTGKISKSVLKPIGRTYTGNSIDFSANKLESVTLPGATQEEIDQTVAVMGGEDWQFWIDALLEDNLIAHGAKTIAYSYMGPDLTKAVYRNGTIGKAKDHLEETAKILDKKLQKINGRALISINKALVTQSSSAIPFIPLYFIMLKKVMKEKNIDEGCIEQMYRLFSDWLYPDGTDSLGGKGFIRIDDLEMRADVQEIVRQRWQQLNDENLPQFADLDGFHADFLKLFGFGFNGVDYNLDIDPDINLPSLES